MIYSAASLVWMRGAAGSCRTAVLSCSVQLEIQKIDLIQQAAAAEVNPDWTPWPVTCQPLRSSPPQTPVMFPVGP
jgi:hypothetical protein